MGGMSLHIIHNPDDTKRLHLLQFELSQQGITDYYLWDAVHDDRGAPQGINKAHKQVVFWAKENDLPFVIIAEDDVKFFDIGAYKYFIDNKPEVYDLYLSGIFLGVVDEHNITEKFTGLTLYIVHKNYYDAFLSADEEEHLDIALSKIGGLFVVCNPFVTRQHNGFSTNEKRYMNYDFMFEHRNVYKCV